MREERILKNLSGIDPRYIEEAAPGEAVRVRQPRVRPAHLLAAAVLTALLLGCGMAAGFFGENIQSWFSHQWERDTGQPMTETHAALLNHLSQHIGLSETVGGVTVTVDSAAVGDDSFVILLRLSGLPFDPVRRGCEFRDSTLDLTPDSAILGGWGLSFPGMDGDGAALMLLEHEYVSGEPFVQDPSPLSIRLTLTDLGGHFHHDGFTTEVPGTWAFDFTLDRSQPLPSIALPDTEVTTHRLGDKEGRETVLLTHMELTSMGLRYEYRDEAYSTDRESFDLCPTLILQNGVEISYKDDSAAVDHGYFRCSAHWRYPVDLSQVSALRMGEEVIPLPQDHEQP